MTEIQVTLSCGCVVSVSQRNVGMGLRNLCKYHYDKNNRPDLLINFYNWYVTIHEGLAKVLNAL